MLVGVPKEIKVHEYRVSLTPEGVYEFIRAGHKVVIEEGAGVGSAISDSDFVAAGATIEKDVANMPGAVPVAATYALTNATLTYALAIANKGWERAASEDPALERGLNVHAGKVRYEAIALAHGYAV
jgi:alanine dehydrogenase